MRTLEKNQATCPRHQTGLVLHRSVSPLQAVVGHTREGAGLGAPGRNPVPQPIEVADRVLTRLTMMLSPWTPFTCSLFQGKCTEADPLFRQALGLAQANMSPDHPTVANVLNNLAASLESRVRDLSRSSCGRSFL